MFTSERVGTDTPADRADAHPGGGAQGEADLEGAGRPRRARVSCLAACRQPYYSIGAHPLPEPPRLHAHR